MEPYRKDIDNTISAMVASACSAESYLEVLDKEPSEMVTANFLARKPCKLLTSGFSNGITSVIRSTISSASPKGLRNDSR